MNQQAFYRDTAIGHFYLNPDGLLVYWSWGERRRTYKAQQHAYNLLSTKRLKQKLVGMWDKL